MSLREITARALRFSGIPGLVRWLITRSRVTIVMYHDPRPEVLDEHLAYMSKHYRFITLDDLTCALHSGNWKEIPPRSLVVTIDDGHRGNRDLGDTFQKYGVRPTIYICTQIVATHRRFWFQVKSDAFAQGFKDLPNSERLVALTEQTGFEQTREHTDSEPHALTQQDLHAMREWADLESHTRFHPILTTCSDELCEEEISLSLDEVEQLVGVACRHFSFPNGAWSERELALTRKAGYRSARSTDLGWNGRRTDPYRLRVTGVTDDASVSVIAVQLSGLIAYFKNLREGRLTGQTRKLSAIDGNAH